jgi:hypothetical protein
MKVLDVSIWIFLAIFTTELMFCDFMIGLRHALKLFSNDNTPDNLFCDMKMSSSIILMFPSSFVCFGFMCVFGYSVYIRVKTNDYTTLSNAGLIALQSRMFYAFAIWTLSFTPFIFSSYVYRKSNHLSSPTIDFWDTIDPKLITMCRESILLFWALFYPL